jgi:hypothetical protein
MAKRKKDKRNGHLQSTTQKTKDRATRTSLKPGVNLSVMNVLTVRPLAVVAVRSFCLFFFLPLHCFSFNCFCLPL